MPFCAAVGTGAAGTSGLPRSPLPPGVPPLEDVSQGEGMVGRLSTSCPWKGARCAGTRACGPEPWWEP